MKKAITEDIDFMGDGIEPSSLSLQVAREIFSKISQAEAIGFLDKKTVVTQQKFVSWSGMVYSPDRVKTGIPVRSVFRFLLRSSSGR